MADLIKGAVKFKSDGCGYDFGLWGHCGGYPYPAGVKEACRSNLVANFALKPESSEQSRIRRTLFATRFREPSFPSHAAEPLKNVEEAKNSWWKNPAGRSGPTAYCPLPPLSPRF
jgi:hypothetical protein